MNLPSQDVAAITRVSAIYEHFQKECADAIAASNLTLAAIQAGVENVQPGAALTAAEVAERLKISEQFVYDLCASGKLACKKISSGRGRHPTVRIPLTALLAYLSETDAGEPDAKANRGLRHLKVRA